MDKARRARLEAELTRHYARGREAARAEVPSDLVSEMLSEDAWAWQLRRMGSAEFVATQVRFIPAWTWAAQVALVACMGMLAYAAGDASSTKAAIGVLSALSVLVAVPTMHASKLHGVAELEYACLHNTASVMVARLIVLGCSSALVVALMVAATARLLAASAFDVALWACLPFFLSCAGSLEVLRKARPAAASTLCVAWTAACSTTLLTLASTLPGLYASSSLAAWATAAAAALAWLVREVVLTLRAAASGLDSFSPQLARTYN